MVLVNFCTIKLVGTRYVRIQFTYQKYWFLCDACSKNKNSDFKFLLNKFGFAQNIEENLYIITKYNIFVKSMYGVVYV